MKYLLAIICLAIPAYLIRFNILGIPSTALEILIYAVFIYGLFLGPTKILRASKDYVSVIFVLFIGLFFSIYISPDRAVALGQAKAFFLDPILVFLLIISYLKKDDLVYLFGGLIGSATIVSMYSVYEKIIGNVTPDNRVIGLFGYSPNYVALFLAPIITIIIILNFKFLILNQFSIFNFQKHKLFIKIIVLLSMIVNLYALYLSGSRGGELAIGAGIIVYLLCYYWNEIGKRLWLKISTILLIVLLIAACAWLFRPNFSDTTGRVASSNNVRWQIWTQSIDLAVKHPYFGIGLGNFQNSFASFTKNIGNFPEFITPEAATAHNIFLMFYLTTSIFGFAAFIWIIFLFFDATKSSFTQNESKILFAAFLTLLFHGLVDAAYFKNDLSLLFWLLFGAIVVLKTTNKEKRS